MQVNNSPKSIEEVPLMIANSYIKNKGIDMTLEKIVERFLPEYLI